MRSNRNRRIKNERRRVKRKQKAKDQRNNQYEECARDKVNFIVVHLVKTIEHFFSRSL